MGMRKAAEGDAGLMKQVWKNWTDEVQETKREAGSQGAMAAMEAKLAASSAAQMEYKKNKGEEDAIRAQEKAMEDFMKQKKDGAKAVLDKMNASTDSGLVEHVISTWCQYYKDDK